jgi:hypothetical protein
MPFLRTTCLAVPVVWLMAGNVAPLSAWTGDFSLRTRNRLGLWDVPISAESRRLLSRR